MYSRLLKKYLNQTVQLKKFSGNRDSYAQPIYNDATTENARVEDVFRLVKNAEGKEIVSKTTVFIEEEVNTEDLINDQEIISVMSMINKYGQVVGYEVYL
jgi:hypothetical protein